MSEEIVKIELNPDLEKDLHLLPAVITSTDEVAEAIAERARALAPSETGEYASSIVAQKANSKGVARVIATDPKASWIEFGNGNGFPAHFTMRSAVESLGLKFKKGR